MITTIPINPTQLRAELADERIFVRVNQLVTDDVFPVGSELVIIDNGDEVEPSAAQIEDISKHIAKPASPVETQQVAMTALETAVAADVTAGKMSADTADALKNLLATMAPRK